MAPADYEQGEDFCTTCGTRGILVPGRGSNADGFIPDDIPANESELLTQAIQLLRGASLLPNDGLVIPEIRQWLTDNGHAS